MLLNYLSSILPSPKLYHFNNRTVHMFKPKLLIFSGSIRGASTNTKLAGCAYKTLSQMNCEPTLISLADYEMPIYDGDLETQKGAPASARKLARLMHESHGMVISSPEYNGSVTPLLKNTIDWVSRVSSDEEGPIVPYKGKFAGLISTSPGQMGGINSITQLAQILSRIGVLVINERVTVGSSGSAFDEMENLSNERSQTLLEATCLSLVEKAAIFNMR